MKHNNVCIKCGALLVVGENVTQCGIDHSQYICQKCQRQVGKEWIDTHPNYMTNYMREYRHRTGQNQPMSENRESPSFLGVHVAERVLSHLFKNVQRMPYGNPGFDFTCGKGYLVDAKCSCRRQHNPPWADNWMFTINKNQIADYFLCLAFDNRNDLNPEHIWLIPAGDVNDHVGISIAESRLDRWQKYEQPVYRVIACCDTLKTSQTNTEIKAEIG